MCKEAAYFYLASIFLLSASSQVFSENAEQVYFNQSKQTASLQINPITPFTGKIIKNKVRVRMQPSLDSPILREISKDDLLIVVGEYEDFYAIQPPEDIKGYIFRTYVLDGVVEGSRVNVRLEPETNAPVIAQLNSGDRIQGIVSPLNSKWFEIAPPDTTRFFVSKEFVEKIGDRNMLANIKKRNNEVDNLLVSASIESKEELNKPFEQINLDNVIGDLTKITNNYTEFTDQVTQAKKLLSTIQESYLQKKIAYLENKANSVQALQNQKSADIRNLNTRQVSPSPTKFEDSGSHFASSNLTDKMSAWIPYEQKIFENWAQQNGDQPLENLYRVQAENALTLQGILEPYTRSVKNKPGDFILVNQFSRLPIAYLYSTQVNLQNKIGQIVTVKASPRPHNNFAYPAYFVLSVE